ncbi:MAG: PatB family C-S lyase [Betaproteobacteria bacterium]|nr:PatB family C-S lyase [Betaproteobacteria bacterium]
MPRYDFTQTLPRHGGDSLKWNKYAGRDILPLWVADMDFAAPPAVREALAARLAEGVYGYGTVPPGLNEIVRAYLAREYDWQIAPEWIVWLPGLVPGLNLACRAVSGGILTATPVYPPFLSAPSFSNRKRHTVALVLEEGRWRWDFAAFAAALDALDENSLFLLCHPHNPVGRAWEEKELRDIGNLCLARGITICSDEIHCDLVLDEGRKHRPFATLGEEFASRTITLMAPSKTYNIPGLGCAFAVISNPELRHRFQGVMRGIVPDANIFGFVACAAAFKDCEDWHQELLASLRGHREFVRASIAEMPLLATTPVEATYLAWIDARPLAERLERKFGAASPLANPARFFEEHGVGLSDGAAFAPETAFGNEGKNWLRLNFGCPRATLEAALERMRKAMATVG